MIFSREVVAIIQTQVEEAWRLSSVLQKRLFLDAPSWHRHSHPRADRGVWIASSSEGGRFGYVSEVEDQKRTIIKVVESDVLVRLTWSFEPADRRRVRLRHLVEAIYVSDTTFSVLPEQIHRKGVRAMRTLQRRVQNAGEEEQLITTGSVLSTNTVKAGAR